METHYFNNKNVYSVAHIIKNLSDLKETYYNVSIFQITKAI